MLVPREDFDATYARVKEGAASGGCTVLIFVAPDVDALCACRIFTTILRADHVAYKIKPVSGYDDLERANEELVRGNSELRSIVLINCAGSVQATGLFDLPRRTKVYVMDSHRPLHLSNIHSKGQVFVLDDGDIAKLSLPEDGSDLDVDASDAEEEEEEEEEGEAELSDNEAEKGSGSPRGRKRKRAAAPSERRRRREALRDYYSGSYYGVPASCVAYELAVQLNRAQNDLLWLAIVGVTDHFVHERIPREVYDDLVQRLHDDVMARNAEDAAFMLADDGMHVPVAEEGKIVFEEEFRFMLHRHWSLYDGLFFSTYVASRLGLWSAGGKDKLNTFLAKMGLPLEQCKQQFSFMSQAAKKHLDGTLHHYAEQHGLDDLVYGSFFRHLGYKATVSAADVVHAVAALLEAGAAWHRADAATAARDGGEAVTTEAVPVWEESFNLAYDCLGSKDCVLLNRGIELAMALQRSVVEEGTAVMEKRLVTNAGPFRYAFLKTLAASSHVFSRPHALGKLCAFVVAAHRESGKWKGKTARPFVLCVQNPFRDVYTVVGVPCPRRFGEVERNQFGVVFQVAAEQITARYKHDGFESSIVEVAQEDLHRFIESLHAALTDPL